MKRPRRVIVGVLLLLSLPLLLVIVDAVSFHVTNRDTESIISSGARRGYVLYVPATYNPDKRTALVISLHGAGLWGAGQRRMTEFDRVADREGFIVVYPSAVRGNGPAIWHVEHSPRLMEDVRFISDLIDSLSTRFNIDRTRIYANGLSNGGGLSFVLSCTMSDRIAAIGLVASAQTLPWIWCQDRKPVPMIAFHGTADHATPYHGGSSWIRPDPFPDITGWVLNWARRNGCGIVPMEKKVAPDVVRREYTSCANQASVVFYTILGGGHTWPGGGGLPEWFLGRTTNGVDASSVMWEFFQQHPLQ